ncbi:MAG: glycosyltransferase family 2 protein [Candidatus Cloacimonetes bacterium]|nr:glycosyltransferase family 2 protein [Candidatus Cloacimonadota bacterium]
MISVIVPCYNEQEVISKFYERLQSVMDNIGHNYEIIFVDDGSSDNTKAVAILLKKKNDKIKVISLSRNFGHQIAVTAGLDYAKGDVVVIIDADLQDPPEVIPEFLSKIKQGYNVVYGKRRTRKGESYFKLLTAKIFYKVINRLTHNMIPQDTGDFRMFDKKVLSALKRMKEKDRFLRGMVSWVGFKQKAVFYNRDARYAGTTHYPLKKMIVFAFNAITGFSSFPLHVVFWLGIIITIVAIFLSLFVFLVRVLFPEYFIPSYSSIILVILFFGGIQIISLGVVGMYIARIFEMSKDRPLYLIDSIE